MTPRAPASPAVERPFRTHLTTHLAGPDIFISYRRSEAWDYAAALCRALEDRGYECFFDRDDMAAGSYLDLCTQMARRSRMFVLIGTPTIFDSPHVAAELHAYHAAHARWPFRRWMRLVPIDVGSTLKSLESPGSQAYRGTPWEALAGRISEKESATAVAAGEPSAHVVESIVQAFSAVRSSARLVLGSLAVAAAILIATLSIVGFLTWRADRALADKDAELLEKNDRLRSAEGQLTERQHRLDDLNGKLTTADEQLRDTAGQLQRATADLGTAREQTAAERTRTAEARAQYAETLVDLNAAKLASWAATEEERDPTFSFRIAERSYATRPTFAAGKVLSRIYNSEDLFSSHVIRDISGGDLAPDGRRALLVRRDERVEVRDLSSGTSVRIPATAPVIGGRFVGGNRVLTWSRGLLELWSAGGENISTAQTDTDELSPVTYCDVHQHVLAAGFTNVSLWDLRTLQQRTVEFPQKQRILVLACSREPSAETFLVHRGEVNVRRFDGTAVNDVEVDLSDDVAALAPDGESVVVADGKQPEIHRRGNAIVALPQHEKSISDIVFSPDGKSLLICSIDGVARWYAWPYRAEAAPRTVSAGNRAYDRVAFSRGGDQIIFGRRDGVAVIHAVADDGRWVMRGHEPGDASNATFSHIAASDGGDRYLTVDRDFMARVWSRGSTRPRLFRSTKNKRYKTEPAYSPSGDIAIATSTKDGPAVEIWSLDGEHRQTIRGHTSFIRSIVYSPDGASLAISSNDRIQIRHKGSVLFIEAEAPFTGILSLGISGNSIVYTPSPAQRPCRAWAWDGSDVPCETPAASDEDQRLAIDMQRTERGVGIVVRSAADADRYWLPLSTAHTGTLAVPSHPNRFGYASIWSEDAVEIVLLDPQKIVDRMNGARVAGLVWKPSDAELSP